MTGHVSIGESKKGPDVLTTPPHFLKCCPQEDDPSGVCLIFYFLYFWFSENLCVTFADYGITWKGKALNCWLIFGIFIRIHSVLSHTPSLACTRFMLFNVLLYSFYPFFKNFGPEVFSDINNKLTGWASTVLRWSLLMVLRLGELLDIGKVAHFNADIIRNLCCCIYVRVCCIVLSIGALRSLVNACLRV